MRFYRRLFILQKTKTSLQGCRQNQVLASSISSPKKDTVADSNLNFTDYRNAFKTKSTWEIIRSLAVLSLCSNQIFSTNSLKIFNWSKKWLGEKLTSAIVKPLFYDQFVAGSSASEIRQTITVLSKAGVGSIIAVALEACNNATEAESNKEKIISMMKLLSENMASPEYLLQFRVSGLFSYNILQKLSSLPAEQRSEAVVWLSEFMKGSDENNIKRLARILQIPDGVEEVKVGCKCLKAIGEEARKTGTILMVDAEYTYINPALTVFVHALSLMANTEKPVVWNTYQCYLKNAVQNVREGLDFAQKNNLHFGAKIVRGAYITSEKSSALEKGYVCPVHDSYDDTNACYDDVVALLMRSLVEKTNNLGSIRFILASHNQDSIQLTTKKMSELRDLKESRNIIFGQLYGMCDHITYTLALHGYPVYKSLAVGTIDETLPYLSRRAQENTSVIVNARQERMLLRYEVRSRLMSALKLKK